MAAQLALKTSDFEARAISPLLEMGAYEALWLRDKASFKTIADLFRDNEPPTSRRDTTVTQP